MMSWILDEYVWFDGKKFCDGHGKTLCGFPVNYPSEGWVIYNPTLVDFPTAFAATHVGKEVKAEHWDKFVSKDYFRISFDKISDLIKYKWIIKS